ncbi:hypothetical protein FQO85_20495 [Salmonella enterica]|nr:hypothetical protein [Salmonella enterica]ECD9531411.1 hypothetical protein [Salmonella enterica subsp. houtenae]EAO7824939.1 hypothetical protein [Salmonella enterica]EAQ7683399.1 hypothetical protein [Salmonella enterica]EAR1801241.1 hypothetical protein [Salmonella enterica]
MSKSGRRLLVQSLAAHLHEASHCAGFLLCKAHRTVATADKVVVLVCLVIGLMCFQKCRA